MSASPTRSAERRAVVAVAAATLLVPLNSTMIAVALPDVIADLDASLASASALVAAYLIATASLHPIGGKLGDRLGRRRLMLVGLGWLAAASLGAALAEGLWLLVGWRVQQGVAGALIVPNGIALLREITPPARLGGRLGLIGAAMTLGAAAGLPVGGALVAVGGWRAIFAANLPVIALAVVTGVRAGRRAARPATPSPFDIAGAAWLCALLGGLAWAMTGESPVWLVVALAAGAALFLVHELRHPDPVLQPRLFGRPAFAAASAGVGLSNLAMYVALLALPLLLSGHPGWGSTQIGLLVAVLPAASFVLSPVGGRLSDRIGRRVPVGLGLAISAAGLLGLSGDPAQLGAGGLSLALAAVGAGLGLASPALQTAALEAVEVPVAGVAAGVFSTSRYLGSIAGTGLLAGPLAPHTGGVGSFGALFAVLAAVAAGSALLALALPGRSGASGEEVARRRLRAAG